MKVSLQPGKYVVAVSGGVDSVVLLDLLYNKTLLQEVRPPWSLVVAHFDHGIRGDSGQDREFVGQLAKDYGLPFFYETGRLGPKASEAAARQARYEFLRKIRNLYEADAIITAHHQDDVIETALINLLRGTGRKGLTSLGSTKDIKRPLLDATKAQLIDYAREHGLAWHEDSTNQDEKYLRNHLRNKILPNLNPTDRTRLLELLHFAQANNKVIDELIGQLLPSKKDNTLDRAWFIDLPHAVAREVLSCWLRGQAITFDRVGIERMVIGLKTLPPGARLDVSGGRYFVVASDNIRLRRQSSV